MAKSKAKPKVTILPVPRRRGERGAEDGPHPGKWEYVDPSEGFVCENSDRHQENEEWATWKSVSTTNCPVMRNTCHHYLCGLCHFILIVSADKRNPSLKELVYGRR